MIAGGQEPTVTCPGQRRPGDVGVKTYLQKAGAPEPARLEGPCANITPRPTLFFLFC